MRPQAAAAPEPGYHAGAGPGGKHCAFGGPGKPWQWGGPAGALDILLFAGAEGSFTLFEDQKQRRAFIAMTLTWGGGRGIEGPGDRAAEPGEGRERAGAALRPHGQRPGDAPVAGNRRLLGPQRHFGGRVGAVERRPDSLRFENRADGKAAEAAGCFPGASYCQVLSGLSPPSDRPCRAHHDEKAARGDSQAAFSRCYSSLKYPKARSPNPGRFSWPKSGYNSSSFSPLRTL